MNCQICGKLEDFTKCKVCGKSFCEYCEDQYRVCYQCLEKARTK